MLEFKFRKKDGEYWIEGKARSCSSKKRMFNHILNEFYKQLPNVTEGKITIEGVSNERNKV